jgi:hypothetical protein
MVFPSLSRAALIGGLDAEAKATADKRLRNFADQAKRPGLPESRGLALEAGARRRSVGIMRDAFQARCKPLKSC